MKKIFRIHVLFNNETERNIFLENKTKKQAQAVQEFFISENKEDLIRCTLFKWDYEMQEFVSLLGNKYDLI